jgi:hypothetical protein
MKKHIALVLFILFPIIITATETRVIVRAKAKDAKFIGSSIGGAYVIIRNELNKEILTEGLTEGGTGNTNLIMKEPKLRNTQLADDNTAGFLASIDIDEPTFVEIEVFSPKGHKQSQIKVSTQLWLIPGKHILGDGVMLEIPGFIIDILEPRTHQFIEMNSLENGKLKLEANIVMMCGCTISKDGIWDSEKMEVKAIIKKDGKNISEKLMQLVSANLFDTEIEIQDSGNYEIIVYAYSEATGNTGVDNINFIIQ